MFGLFADPGAVTIAPGQTLEIPLYAYAPSPISTFKLETRALDPALTATLATKTAKDGDVIELTLTASSAYIEAADQNLVLLYAGGISDDYVTKRALIVHAAQ